MLKEGTETLNGGIGLGDPQPTPTVIHHKSL